MAIQGPQFSAVSPNFNREKEAQEQALTLGDYLRKGFEQKNALQAAAQRQQMQDQAAMDRQGAAQQHATDLESSKDQRARDLEEMKESSAMERAQLEADTKKEIARMALAKFLKGQANKPLSSEEQKRYILAKTGQEAVDRLQKNQPANPGATKAVVASEKVGRIPIIGGVGRSLITGISNLINPATASIEADRERAARNQLYLDTGATATDDETLGKQAQLPGITADPQQTKQMFDVYSSPYKDVKRAYQGRPGAVEGSMAGEESPEEEKARLLRELGL